MGLDQLAPVGIAFVFVAVVITVGSTILTDISDDFVTNTAGCNATSRTDCGYNYNATAAGQDGATTLSAWLPTIALVTAAAVVISVLSFFRN